MLRLALFSLLLATAATAQTRAHDAVRPSPNAVIGQTVGTTDVLVTYGRPSVRGRDVFGPDSTSLVPYGEVWRLGANEATTMTVSAPVRIAGQPLEAGTYAVFAIPGPTEWTLIFNRTAEQWGAFRYDSAQDALRVMVTPEAFPHTQEMFTVAFDRITDDGAMLMLGWDRVRVPVQIQTAM